MFEPTDDMEQIIFEEDCELQDISDNCPYIMIGQPVNPLKVIEVYIELLEQDGIPHHGNNGGFLIANPRTINSGERVKEKNWSKLPSIALSLDPAEYDLFWGEGDDYSGSHEFKNTKWNGDWSKWGVTEYVHSHGENPDLIARLMKLDRQQDRLKEVIIRRLLSN